MSKRCNATVDARRCDYTGDDLPGHAEETGHLLCAMCSRSLYHYEVRTCGRCVARTRAALTTIRDTFSHLEPVIELSALHPGDIPGGTAMVMVADGNASDLRPYKPAAYRDPAPTSYPNIRGTTRTVHYWKRDRFGVPQPATMTETTDHPAYADSRPVPDGREHYADHWASDPTVPLAVLEVSVRDWRHEFRQPPADEIASIANTTEYLILWAAHAANVHPCFEEFAREIIDLASAVAHVAGDVNDPVVAAASCFDCGGDLTSAYRDRERRDHTTIHAAITAQREAERSYGLPLTPLDAVLRAHGSQHEGRRMIVTDADEPALDLPVWECRHCGRRYEPAEYWLAVRAFLESA